MVSSVPGEKALRPLEARTSGSGGVGARRGWERGQIPASERAGSGAPALLGPTASQIASNTQLRIPSPLPGCRWVSPWEGHSISLLSWGPWGPWGRRKPLPISPPLPAPPRRALLSARAIPGCAASRSASTSHRGALRAPARASGGSMFKAAAAAGGERRAAGAETEPGLGLLGRRDWSEEAPPQAAPPHPALPVSPSSPSKAGRQARTSHCPEPTSQRSAGSQAPRPQAPGCQAPTDQRPWRVTRPTSSAGVQSGVLPGPPRILSASFSLAGPVPSPASDVGSPRRFRPAGPGPTSGPAPASPSPTSNPQPPQWPVR